MMPAVIDSRSDTRSDLFEFAIMMSLRVGLGASRVEE